MSQDPAPMIIPLSFAQQRLWFLHELGEADASYHICFVVRLRGELDRQALHSAFRDVLDRHEILRTVIPAADGIPRQRILKTESVEFDPPVVDIRADQVTAAVAEAARTSFDLRGDPTARARLARGDPSHRGRRMVVGSTRRRHRHRIFGPATRSGS